MRLNYQHFHALGWSWLLLMATGSTVTAPFGQAFAPILVPNPPRRTPIITTNICAGIPTTTPTTRTTTTTGCWHCHPNGRIGRLVGVLFQAVGRGEQDYRDDSDDKNNDDNNDDDDDSWDYDSYQQALIHNQLRTDVRIFLTQRALQSFIYLLLTCRDPHTVRWLENTYDFANLESYHGTGALNLTRFDTWDALFLDLVQRPNAVIVVAARRRGQGHGGWSSHNPHLAAEGNSSRFVEFEIDVEPVSLVSRLVSVRNQIAQEWVMDLETLVAVNALILDSYHATQNQQRMEEKKDALDKEEDERNRRRRRPLEEEGQEQNVGHTDHNSSPKDSSSSSRHHEQSSQQQQQHPLEYFRGGGRQAYESLATLYLNNKMMEHESRTGRPSSAQRRGNFDLLSLLATQEAVHVVLRQYLEQGPARRVSLHWLRQFYQERLTSHFDGDGPYGRSEDFLQQLLLAPPTIATSETTTTSKKKTNSRAMNQKNQKNMVGVVMELVDPLRIAEDIIHARAQVALDWKDIMETVVPSDHMQLQKTILAVRMKPTASFSSSLSSTTTESPPLPHPSSLSQTVNAQTTTTTTGEFE